MKNFSKFQKANLKRYAQIMEPLISKRTKAVAKIITLQEEINEYQRQLDLTDALVKEITGGYGIESIVKKVVTPTDKLDKNGNVIKVTTFEFIYPDTIIPPTEDNKLIMPEVEYELECKNTDETTTEGSDFDVDTTTVTTVE